MQQLRWRKAIIISVLFQFFCLGSVGWMAANYFVPPEVEQYLEIELATEVEQEIKTQSMGAPQQPNQVSLPGNPLPIPTHKASAASPKVIVSDEAMSVVSTDAPAAATESVGTGSGVSTAVGSSGSGEQGSSNGSNGSGSSSAGRKQGGVIRPSILSKVKPTYPQSARSAGIEGTVIVKIQVLTNGRPGNVSIARSSGNRDLDNAAIDAVEQFQFVPAKDRDSGEPIVCYCNLPVKFDLDS